MCKKEKKVVFCQPSRTQLMMGGYPVKMENRCQACETKLAKKIEKLLAKGTNK